MTPALETIKRMSEQQATMFADWRRAIEEHGYVLWKGRKVLLTYEDTGKPTHEK